jgi:hypothetical protein
MTIEKLPTAKAPAESVTFTEKEKVPNTEGVPEILPAAFIERPAGNDPEINAHENGARPLPAVKEKS